MSYVNKTKTKQPVAGAHLNFMGGESYDIKNPIARLRLAAASCFFGEPMYYHRDDDDKRSVKAATLMPGRLDAASVKHLREVLDAVDPKEWRGLTPAGLMEKSIDEALDHDPEATLALAAELRQEAHIRTTPQVILVRAAHHPKVRGPKTGAVAPSLVHKYAPQIISRADEPAVGLAYHQATYGKDAPIPNSLKKAWARALQGASAYSLAKYRMDNREAKLVDVMNLVHPKGEAVSKLAKGELKNTGETWEAIVSGKGSNRAAWEEALPKMGHMALLRNLRNLLKAGVPAEKYKDALVDGAEDGKQLPFRYYSAYRAIENDAPPSLLDAVEECLTKSLGNLPRFPGKTMALVDNSGSARGTTTSSMGSMQVATIGNLTGIVTGMVSDEGYVGVFGDDLKVQPIRKKDSVFTTLKKVEEFGERVGGGTENGIWMFWKKAIKDKEHWDNVFVYSDMQAGHGGLYGVNPSEYSEFAWGGSGNHIDVAKLVAKYRREVNPNVMVYLVQIAGYQDTIIPEFYNKTYILGGWGEGVLKFAAQMSGLGAQKQDR